MTKTKESDPGRERRTPSSPPHHHHLPNPNTLTSSSFFFSFFFFATIHSSPNLVHLFITVCICRRFSLSWFQFEGFVSSCNKEVHGSGASRLHGWYTEALDLELRKIAELNEAASVARRSLTRPVAWSCWNAQSAEDPPHLRKRWRSTLWAIATQEQITEAMNAMQRQIAELAGQLAEERHRGASLDRVAQVLDRWTTQQAQQPVARLVDTRGIGRPSNFGSGEEKSFPVWQRKMQNYIVSVFPDLREPLEWAAMQCPSLISSSTKDSAQKQIPRIKWRILRTRCTKSLRCWCKWQRMTPTTSSAIRAEWGWKLGGSWLADGIPDWESPPESPQACDQHCKGKLTELPGALERWEETGFEVQELQGPAGTESRHTRGHSLGIVGSDRSGGSSTDETVRCGGVGSHRVSNRFKDDRDQGAQAWENPWKRYGCWFCGQRQRQEQFSRRLLQLWQGRSQGHRGWSRDRASNKGSGRNPSALKRPIVSSGSFVVCVCRQRSSDQDDHKGKKSHNETCFQDPQSCCWLVVWSNQFGLQNPYQIHWHQKPTRRHTNQGKLYTWWVEGYVLLRPDSTQANSTQARCDLGQICFWTWAIFFQVVSANPKP